MVQEISETDFQAWHIQVVREAVAKAKRDNTTLEVSLLAVFRRAAEGTFKGNQVILTPFERTIVDELIKTLEADTKEEQVDGK